MFSMTIASRVARALAALGLLVSGASAWAALAPDGSYAQDTIRYTDANQNICDTIGNQVVVNGTTRWDIEDRLLDCANAHYDNVLNPNWFQYQPEPDIQNQTGPTSYQPSANPWRSIQGQSYTWSAAVWYSYGGVYLGNVSGTPGELACPASAPILSGSTCSCPGTVKNSPLAGGNRCFPTAPPAASNGSPDDSCESCDAARSSGNNSGGGDPIHLGSGNMFLRETDVVQVGGTGLSFSRYYNSNDMIYGNIMSNWRGDYLSSFNALKFTYVNIGGGLQTVTAKLLRDDGREMTFTATYNPSTGLVTTPWTSTTEKSVRMETVIYQGGWTGVYVRDNSSIYRLYNRSGRLTHVYDGDGVRLTLTLGSSGPTRVQDRFGNRLDFTYTSGKVTGLSVNGSSWATYTYGTAVNTPLIKVTYADGKFREYKYQDLSNPNVVTSVVDERGITVNRWSYDNEGRGTGSELADGRNPVDITYNTDGTVTETFANGLSYVYTFQTVAGRKLTTRKDRYLNNVLAAYYETTYDTAGNRTQERDWEGNITQRTFNSRNLETSRTEAYGTTDARTITTTWDSVLDRPASITTPDKVTTFTYSNGKLATRTETDSTAWSAGSRTWTYSYYSNGLLQTVNGPRTDVTDTTTYTYTANGWLASVTNALSQVTTFGSHNNLGLPQTLTDPNGNVTNFTYDARGRLLTSTFVDPVAGSLVTTYTYDDAGHVTEIELPDSSTLTYEYDDNGDVAAIEDATGARLEYERDDEGNITRIHTRNAGGALVRRIDQTWDGMRRLLTLSGVSQLHASYDYDENGNRVSVTDGLNHTTLTAFDALDRLVSSTDAASAVTAYGYNAEGNLATVTDARTLETEYEYDGFGCLRRLTSPDTDVTTYTCDKAGNVTGKTDARGVVATYGYDAINRRTSALYTGAPSETALYGYDATAGGNEGVGRLTAAQNDGADIALKYDARGNVIEDVRVIGGITYTTQYTYDDAGRLTAIVYPTGRTVTYVRDAAGEITSVTTQASGGSPETVASNIAWEPFGPLAALTHGNGLAQLRTYDTDGRLTEIEVDTLFTRSYTYDGASRITAITDSTPANSETYVYDEVDRLTEASGPYGDREYTYDDVGNRITQDEDSNTSSYSYGTTSNRLYQITGTDAAALDYDDAGNTIEKGDIDFSYNAANRLASVTVPGSGGPETTNFAYTALGERVIKDGPLGETHFHYDRAGHLIAETDGTGATVREYLWLGDTPIGLVAIRNAGTTPELFAVHADHLDTALALTDSTQAVAWRYDREPFGELNAGGYLVKWPLRFPGQYQDNETGLYYNYFRDYDPATGRYVESDPIGLRGGVNVYGYALQQPIRLTDKRGLNASICVINPHAIGCEPWTGGGGTPHWGGGGAGALPGLGAICTMLGICEPDYQEEPPRGLHPEGLQPPVPEDKECEIGPASRPSEAAQGGQSYWDPDGGEWRWYPGDKHHNPHWDYNPHDNPNSPWQNIPHGDLPPVKPNPM